VSVEKIRVESHQELEQMITNEISQIEKGLTVICSKGRVSSTSTSRKTKRRSPDAAQGRAKEEAKTILKTPQPIMPFAS